MQTIKTQQDGVTVVELRGRLDSQTSPAVEKDLMSLVESNEKKVLVDCQSLAYVSSAGLRVFLMVQKALKQRGGTIVFAALNGSVKMVFRMAGLPPLVGMYDTREDALAVLKAG